MDRASVSVAVDVGFDSESGQTNYLNIDIHSFSWLTFSIKRDSVEIQQQPSFIFLLCLYFSMIPP